MPCIGLLYWGVFLSLPVVCLVWPIVGVYARLYIMDLCSCVVGLCSCVMPLSFGYILLKVWGVYCQWGCFLLFGCAVIL